MNINLSKPSIKLLPSYIEAIKEGEYINMQLGFGDTPSEEINKNPKDYIKNITSKSPFTLTKNDKNYEVTEHEILWITEDSSRFIGTAAFRYKGDKELINTYAGNLGMAIRPTLKGQGYGSKALPLIIDRFKQKNFKSIIWTCNENNTASQKLIEKFGGQIEDKYEDKLFGGKGIRYRLEI
jgi:predicted acetyltransferase